MANDRLQRPFTVVERSLLFLTRIITTTLLTAFLAAIENSLYERLFEPESYKASLPLMRELWLVWFSFPFILGGLLFSGLPVAYLLHRGRLENTFSYIAAGALTGLVWIWIIGIQPAHGSASSAFLGSACALIWWMLRRKG